MNIIKVVKMVTLNQIQSRLADAIKHSDMTQTAIANAIGVSQQVISSYVYGKKMPALDTFANLCKLLDIDTNEILCQEDF